MLTTNTDPNTYTVLPQERQPAFDALLAELIAEHQPATPTERFLVLEMARAQWKIARVAVFETSLMYNENIEHVGQMGARFDPQYYLGGASPGLNRYEATARRSFYQALRQLQVLRRARTDRPAAPPQAVEKQNYKTKPIRVHPGLVAQTLVPRRPDTPVRPPAEPPRRPPPSRNLW